jgi:hypothetical protein
VTACFFAKRPQKEPYGSGFIGFTSVLVPPSFLYISVTGQGNASHLGATSAVTDNQIVNVDTGSATATYTVTGASGDTVVLEMIF